MYFSIDLSEEKENEKIKKAYLFDFPGNYQEELNEALTTNFIWSRQQKENDESIFENNSHHNFDLNIITKVQSIDIICDKIAKSTTLASPIKEKSEIIKSFVDMDFQTQKHEKLLGKARGRKKKEDEYEYSEHGKYSDDNMMRKIKTHLMEYIINLLNNSLKDKTVLFYRIDKQINEILKKDFNMALMERTLKDIFSNTKISKKYKNNISEYSNALLIEKIFERKNELETIKILEQKFIEVINRIRSNHLDKFLKIIEKKENNNQNKNISQYMEKLKSLFIGYKDWFENKKGRNRDKNSENKKV